MTDVVVIGGIFREHLGESQPEKRIGGSGFVAALAARALGAEVEFVSFVGTDDRAACFGPLERAGVGTAAIQIRDGQSGIFSISDVGDRRAPRPGYRPAEDPPNKVAPHDIPRASVVLGFGFPEFDPQEWIANALEPGGTLLWDRQGWFSRDLDRSFLAELHASRAIFLANLEEMRAVAQSETYVEALAAPPDGFSEALIKCGRWGTVAIEAAGDTLVPAYVTPVRSTIGSGDCFAGAVAARIAGGASLADAAHAGAAAASLFVERRSNIPPQGFGAGVDEVLHTRPRCAVDPKILERTRVYLAGPWFSAGEELLVAELEGRLDAMGVAVCSPRRDIGELAVGAPHEEVRRIGEEDYAAIAESDLIVGILDGNDPGTLMELGWAAHAEIPIIGLLSTAEAAPQPMRVAAGVRVARSLDELTAEVTAWLRERHGV